MQEPLRIYEQFPRREGRKKSLLEIERALSRLQHGECGVTLSFDEAVALLIDATEEYARSPAGNRGRYTPMPQTWFHQSRYLDDRKCWYLLDREEEELLARQARANVGVWRPT